MLNRYLLTGLFLFSFYPALQAQVIQAFQSMAFDGPVSEGECLSAEQRRSIAFRLREAKEALGSSGRTAIPDFYRHERIRYIQPLKANRASGCAHISAVSAFCDHNPLGGSLDYNCGTRTYDGHTGTDFFPWPFPWTAMEYDWAEVIAAAPGYILYKEDGHFDRSCSLGSPDWNAIYLLHEDGSTTWYGHLKSGSLNSKRVGEWVDRGELLGIVGSSGNSTGPHLHFEIHDAADNLIDPYAGICNPGSAESLWAVSESYRESRINQIAFHDRFPEYDDCSSAFPEKPYFRNRFYAGEEIVLGIYLRDPRNGQKLNISVFRPNGSLFKRWERLVSYTASAGAESFRLRLNRRPDFGTWQVRVDLEGAIETRSFELCASETHCTCEAPVGLRQTSLSEGALVLYWNGPENAEEYQLRVETPDRPTKSYFSENTHYDLASFSPGTDLSWSVRARCGYLHSDWSAALSSQIPYPSSGADDAESVDSPERAASGWYWPESGSDKLELYNASGQRVATGIDGQLLAPFGLEQGLYFIVRLRTDGSRQLVRVIW